MAFRRFASSRRRFGSSRFRGRRPLRRIVQTARWEVGRIFFDSQVTMPAGSGASQLLYLHLASIASSLSGSAAGGGPEQRVGTVLAGMQRSLEIGGVVLDYDSVNRGDVPGNFLAGEATWDTSCFLIVDRQSGGGPASVPVPISVSTWDPFLSSFPTALLLPTTPNDQSEPSQAPTRILWQKNWTTDIRPKVITNDIEGDLYVPQNQRLARAYPSTLNRRLRLRLDESQGLYFVFATRNSPNNALGTSQRALSQRLWGTIYYRFVS